MPPPETLGKPVSSRVAEPMPAEMAGWRLALRRWVVLAVAAAALVATGVVAWPLAELAVRAPELPQWDMAKYGVSGLRLAQAFERLDFVGFLHNLHELSVWPPTFPLLEVPVFLLFGAELGVARGLVVALFVAGLLAAFACGRRLGGDPPSGVAVGGLLVAALVASPSHQLFATLIMLEVPGALFQLLALGAYLRALERQDPSSWRWAVVASTLLFFCKYNYGLLWLVPVLLSEARRASGSWRALAGATGRWLRRVDWRRPWTLFLLLALVGLAALRLSGGFELEIAGRTVRASSLGNPVYGLYLIVLVRWLLHPRENVRRLRAWLRGLAPERRSFVLGFVLPVGLWMLAPSHTKNFFNFIENRDSGLGLWSLESWLFYPRAFVAEFSPAPVLGWLALVLAGVFVARLPWVDDRRRVLALALVVAAAAAQFHPYKLPRFFFPVAPWVWLAAAVMVVDATLVLARRRGEVAALLAVAACLLAARAGVDRERWQRDFARHTVPAAVRPVVDAVTEACVETPGVVLLGTWNLFSPPLAEWSLRARAPEAVDRLRFVRPGRGAEGVERELESLPAGGLVLVLERTGADEGFGAETAWLAPVRSALDGDARFERVWQRDFPAAGYRLEAYSRSPPGVAGGLRTPLVSSSAMAAS